jgi:hypothetical protein
MCALHCTELSELRGKKNSAVDILFTDHRGGRYMNIINIIITINIYINNEARDFKRTYLKIH